MIANHNTSTNIVVWMQTNEERWNEQQTFQKYYKNIILWNLLISAEPSKHLLLHVNKWADTMGLRLTFNYSSIIHNRYNIQCKPLNVIKVNVIIRLMWSIFLRFPKPIWLFCCEPTNESVRLMLSVLCLFQSDHIKWLPL